MENTDIVINAFKTLDVKPSSMDLNKIMEWLKPCCKHLFQGISFDNMPIDVENIQNFINELFTKNVDCLSYIPITPIDDGNFEWFFDETEISIRTDTLIQQIKGNTDLFCEIEDICRGISPRYTKEKSVPLLVDYLQFYKTLINGNRKKLLKLNEKQIIVGLFSDCNCLSFLGLLFGSSLAAGYQVVVFVEPKISFIASQISLLIQSCFGDTIFKVNAVESIDGIDRQKLLTNNVRIAFAESQSAFDHFIFWSPGSVFIICDDCDIHSACQKLSWALLEAQCKLPWTPNCILIQESIFDIFVSTLKKALLALVKDNTLHRTANVRFNSDNDCNLIEIEKNAKNRGVDVFKIDTDLYQLLLLIRDYAKIDSKKPITSLISFRTIREGIKLLNSYSSNDLAVSIWTESMHRAKEIANEVEVSLVWINAFGELSPEIAISLRISKKVNYFGGREGFYDLLRGPMLSGTLSKNDASLKRIYNESKIAQKMWNCLQRRIRLNSICSAMFNISTTDCSDIVDWQNILNEIETNHGKFYVVDTCNIIVEKYPKGVVAFNFKKCQDMNAMIRKMVLLTLIEGNAILIVNEKDGNTFLKCFAKTLPTNLISFFVGSIPFGYFDEYIEDFTKFKFLSETNSNCFVHAITKTKQLWYNLGRSL